MRVICARALESVDRHICRETRLDTKTLIDWISSCAIEDNKWMFETFHTGMFRDIKDCWVESIVLVSDPNGNVVYWSGGFFIRDNQINKKELSALSSIALATGLYRDSESQARARERLRVEFEKHIPPLLSLASIIPKE